MTSHIRCIAAFVVLWLFSAAGVAWAQSYGEITAQPASSYPPSTRAARPATAAASFKPEELEQIVAPIALYPDSLLAQVFMASTYPLEIVQADRWVKQNPSLKDSPDALNKLTWDPSVKSLINFPQVLTMMSEKLEWTVKLGDAFIADQKAVMDAVQRLRNKAYANGNLKPSSEQKVTVQPTTAPAAQGAPPQVVVIESSSPSVVYVPTYNPTVVYGGWPYPSYPPYSYYPPGYVAGTAMLSFGIGVACGAAWGHAWGGCNWGHSEVDVDIDRNVNFNSNIDRDAYKAERQARQTDRQGNRSERQTNRQNSPNAFQHDPAHRQGVSYRDSATNERFRGSSANQATAQARDSYRGRAEAGRADLNRGGASAYRGTGGTGARTGGSASPSRSSYGSGSSGFSGANSSGASARASSSRGQSSRSSSAYSSSRSGGSYSRSAAPRPSGGSRSGGGGFRGGGGRGGGRR